MNTVHLDRIQEMIVCRGLTRPAARLDRSREEISTSDDTSRGGASP